MEHTCEFCGAERDLADWRAVPGHSDYEINPAGLVRSWKPWRGLPTPRLMTRTFSADGYPRVDLDAKSFGLHRVLAWTFIGPQVDGQYVRHLDGNVNHLCLENLAYGTPTDNAQDCIRHGTNYWRTRATCKRGHALTPDNLLGLRRCKTCNREKHLARYHAAAEAKREELADAARTPLIFSVRTNVVHRSDCSRIVTHRPWFWSDGRSPSEWLAEVERLGFTWCKFCHGRIVRSFASEVSR